MRINTRHLLTMLVVAGISAVAFPANAATTYAAGDVLLGFRSTTDTTKTLVVNITGGAGPANAAALRDANANAGTTLININQALTDTFGAGWATDSTITWGAVGVYSNSAFDPTVDGDPAQTIYMSRANSAGTAGVQSSAAPKSGTNGTQHTAVANAVAGFEQLGFANFTGTTSLGGLAAEIPTANANSWEEFTAGANDFTISANNVEGVVGTVSGKVLDLYRIEGVAPRTGTWEGTLALSTTGDVSFASTTVAAVPEPSRALLAAAGLFASFMRRRRRA
jgi:MYXO-CTERM domain-containing protein